METLTATKTPANVWKVAYDGLILGDDRGFATEELCNQEIAKRLAKDAAKQSFTPARFFIGRRKPAPPFTD